MFSSYIMTLSVCFIFLTEAKHGGHKNGRKGGLSGSSFFTWFMVIALLGVWTSVAVVWFDLVDYEEVLGKDFHIVSYWYCQFCSLSVVLSREGTKGDVIRVTLLWYFQLL